MYLTHLLDRGVQQRATQAYTIDGDRTFTFAQTRERVARIAGALIERGIGPGDRIGLLANNSDAYLQMILAISWADAIFVPINTRWSRVEVADALYESGVRALLVDDDFIESAEALRAPVPSIEFVIHHGERDADAVDFEDLVTEGRAVPDARRSGSDTAGIFYTGGTTGRSRGAVLSHRALVTSAMAFNSVLSFPQGTNTLVVAPMFHLAQQSAWIAASLSGSTHIVLPTFDPVSIMRAIEERRVERIMLIPTMIQMLLQHPALADHDLSSLRTIVYGGSPITQATLDSARSFLPQVQFAQVYGMTEMSAVATALLPEDHNDPTRARSAGRAAPHVALRIVDAEGDDVDTGTAGEIVLSGDGMMDGYWCRDDETAAVMQDGWLHTGDGGFVDENGYLFVLDRIKDMIVTGGENVYSIEVENAIATHPAVAQCAVIGVPSSTWGEEVHAVVVLRDGDSLDLENLRSHCEQVLAGYKCPRGLTVVEELPLSGAGKILKRQLRTNFETQLA